MLDNPNVFTCLYFPGDKLAGMWTRNLTHGMKSGPLSYDLPIYIGTILEPTQLILDLMWVDLSFLIHLNSFLSLSPAGPGSVASTDDTSVSS